MADFEKINKGGWLAGKKKLVGIVVAVVIAIAAWLVGDQTLVDAITSAFTTAVSSPEVVDAISVE